MSFVHLHVHSEYSLLDGACKIEELVGRVSQLGQKAVAITDHGVMYGVIDFYKAAKAAGIKPIIGCEVYVAPRCCTDRVYELDAEARHLVLLCKDETGYRNLSYMVSCGFLEGFYIKPRVDMELLREHSEGLIALSACLAGEIPRRLREGNYEAAKKTALEFQEIFGKDNFYLELQDHGIASQDTVNKGILRLHEETQIPLVVTNDAHYLTKEDAYMQDVLLCIQTNKTVENPDRMKFETTEFYIKSEEEMASLFPDYPEAISNTAEIANRCNLEIEFGTYHLPEFKHPQGLGGYEYLEELCQEGFLKRYPQGTEEYRQRLFYELQMIRQMGFVDYFLIVGDFISYAKSQDIPVGPGRGSAAGSMVSYCLGITDIDPMKYNLYFERFLNPERVSMPDIDIDFCYIRRQEVIDYVTQKYGTDHVAQIVTFGTMAARGAIRDVGRALNFTYAEVDVVAKLVPSALHITLDDALKVSPQLKETYDGDARVKKLIDTARSLEGMPRHASTHAAGVVITKNPVYNYVPLSKNDEAVVTQFPMTTLEELGLLKMDFLGLRNLTVIHDAEKEIQKNRPDFAMGGIPDDDPETFAMLSEGKTSGVFQMESAGMTSVCVGLKPQNIEDITAIVALYRPGPMESIPRFIASKHNPEQVTYKHPLLKDILQVTYGCIVYQEQVIEIFRKLGGYSLGQADTMRRAISKKKQAVIVSERQHFIYGDPERNIPGAVKSGVDEETAKTIYDEILDFANYAFNKAHAVAYAVVAYQTAYLKCHYPKEYMAALMTSILDNTARISEYIAECKELSIDVLPPDINESEDNFIVSGNQIRFGLAAVKNIGRGLIKKVVAQRENGGKFTSFLDFLQRMYGGDLNKRALESLIKCGAMDSFGHKRSQLLAVYEPALEEIARGKRKNLDGQVGLFDPGGSEEKTGELELPNIPELSRRELMEQEKETTGLYITGHPMDDYRDAVKKARTVQISRILDDFAQEGGATEFQDDQYVKVAGIIQSVRTKVTKNNSMMAYIMLEDDSGSIELLAFARVLNESGGYIRENAAVLVEGRISVRDDKDPQILCAGVRPLSDLDAPEEEGEKEELVKKLYLKIPSETAPVFQKVRSVLNMFPGKMQTVLYFADTGKKKGGFCMNHELLIPELRNLLGEDNVVLK